MSKYRYVRSSGVRALIKEQDKRCSRDFLDALDRYICELICRSCKVFNGHKKTLDSTVFNFTKKGV